MDAYARRLDCLESLGESYLSEHRMCLDHVHRMATLSHADATTLERDCYERAWTYYRRCGNDDAVNMVHSFAERRRLSDICAMMASYSASKGEDQIPLDPLQKVDQAVSDLLADEENLKRMDDTPGERVSIQPVEVLRAALLGSVKRLREEPRLGDLPDKYRRELSRIDLRICLYDGPTSGLTAWEKQHDVLSAKIKRVMDLLHGGEVFSD